MADDFGLKIGIKGEKEFEKALTDIDQSFKVLGIKLAVSQFDKNARNEVLNRQIDEQKSMDTFRADVKVGLDVPKLDNTPSDWSKETISWAIQMGILRGDNGDLMLRQPLTREQFCMMLCRYNQLKGTVKS